MMVEAMSNASLDRLLAVLLTAAAGTGFLTLHNGQPGDAWLFVLHDLVTGALGIAAVVKLRRSLPRAVIGRRWPRLMVAVVLTGTVGGALAGGYLWVAGGGLAWADLASGRWTVLTLHAWLGLAIAAVAFIHLLPHRWRLLRPGPAALTASGQRLRSRRAFLAGSSLAVASVALVGFVNVVDRLNGGVRRFTGSR